MESQSLLYPENARGNFLLKEATFGEFVVFLRIGLFFLFYLIRIIMFVLFHAFTYTVDLYNLCNFLCSKIITQTGTKLSYCLLHR